MSETLEQIALRVADETRNLKIMLNPEVIQEFAHRLVEALGAQEHLGPIDHDTELDRYYIPVHPKWEIQTKGKGSSFRIAQTAEDGHRWLVADTYLHAMLEEMARDIHAYVAPQLPREPICGKNYEAGLWSRRNYEAWLEDQAAAPKEPT